MAGPAPVLRPEISERTRRPTYLIVRNLRRRVSGVRVRAAALAGGTAGRQTSHRVVGLVQFEVGLAKPRSGSTHLCHPEFWSREANYGVFGKSVTAGYRSPTSPCVVPRPCKCYIGLSRQALI